MIAPRPIAVTWSAPESWLSVGLGVACSVDPIAETIAWWLRRDAAVALPADAAALPVRLIAAPQVR